MKDSEEHTSYDEVPYESQSFPQSHPDRLATLGRLFGLSPTPIAHCRVLELGCASGGNLIPMAYHLPESEFVGVDLSRRQVEMGQQTIRDLGLENIRIKHGSIMDVDSSWGVFDYIIAHGVYSWVPDEVQDKILAVSSDNLAPQGIAYVSYNTFPGWHMREMVRHMMLYHANQFEESSKRIEQARALMDFLAGSVPTENDYYGMLLKNELELIRCSRDWYLFHDHLEEINAPIYFYQFIERAERHGLQYLAEAEFSTMLTKGFPEEVAETLRRVSQHIIHTEQYMDFVRNRLFRQTLLCHKTSTLKRDLGGDDVSGMLVASTASPETKGVNLLPGKKESFRTPAGATAETSFPLTKAALVVLRERWPRAVDVDTLSQEANRMLDIAKIPYEAHDQENQKILAEDLLHCYSIKLVEFHTWQADFVTEVSEQPRVSRLVAYLGGQDRPVVNQRHEMVNLDLVSKELVCVLDGTRDLAGLLKRLEGLVEDGSLVVREDSERLKGGTKLESALKEILEQTLVKLAGAGMLVG
jgi:methyltransferase-like protein/SAM-dependent methyltransferase